MTLTRVRLERFTAFKRLDLELSPGINVLVGENGTGKTHLMKVCYAACDISKTRASFTEKLIDVFLPSGHVPGRLVKRQRGSIRGAVEVFRDGRRLRTSFSNHAKVSTSAHTTGANDWVASPVESVYIPVKEMLANGPGFLSLYTQRDIHFEEIYVDILQRAYLPLVRGPMDKQRRRLFNILQKAINGQVTIKNVTTKPERYQG
ncbi:MAG: AAA family ATPase [Caldilineaceae bacterium SB0665_bin_25]|nr:AAA family ATPase [Caldilineaceae bacterium SB0665_bin_25]